MTEPSKIDLTKVDHAAKARTLICDARDSTDNQLGLIDAVLSVTHAILALVDVERVENEISEKSAVAETRLASTVNDAGRIQVMAGRSA